MGTFTPAWDIGNSSGSFSEQSLAGTDAYKTGFVHLTPAIDLGSGEYTLMLGAQCIFSCTK